LSNEKDSEGFIKMGVREIGFESDVTGVETSGSTTMLLACICRHSNDTEISNQKRFHFTKIKFILEHRYRMVHIPGVSWFDSPSAGRPI
jgi:hypothetical protein